MSNGGPEVRQIRFTLGGALTPVVRVLLWANAGVFASLQLASGRELSLGGSETRLDAVAIALLGLVPRSVTGDLELWQPFTYMFVHQELWHFLFNMLGLWWFGAEVERFLGSRVFWRFYVACGLGAAATALAWDWNGMTVTVGASGAIFGVLVAYGFLFPDRTLYLYFVIPVRAKYCVALFGLVTVFALLVGQQDGVSHIAHFGGMLVGLVWFGLFRGRGRLEAIWRVLRKRRMRGRLRLIRKGESHGDDGPFQGYDNKTVH
jgi:membrane associated rhomboid family serine protease